MGKPAHLKLQAKLDMVKRKMGVEDGKLNPFDHIKVNTRRQVLNKGEHKYKHTCAKSVTEVIKKPLGSAGNNVHVIADINDERIVPKQGEKGYSYQRSELIRHSVNQIPQKFDFPDNTRPDERIFYEREMRQRARDVYAEVRAKAKAYREEHKRINRDVSEAVQQLDRAYGTMSRLLPKETRLGSQSIVAEFQPLDGVRVHASRGATNLADAVRACAETLEKMDKDRSTIPAIRPKLDHKQSTNISSNDPECLNGDFNLGDNFSSDTPEESDTQIGTEHDEQSDADDTREHQLPHFLCREVQPTYFEKLSFSLPVPSTMDDFQIMLDSVQSIEEILVLDRLIKSNSTLVDGSNRPEMERLASFCTTRFMYLIYDAPELDPVRIDAQARGLRHITSEIPHYMMSAYQKLILTYHKAVQAVNFMGIFLCNQEALKSKCSNKKKRIECLDSVLFSSVSVTSKKTESYDEQQNEFLSLHGRAIFGGVMLSNLMALIFPQGTWYTLSPDEFTLTNMRVFEEQPLYTAMFLANDTPIQGMCLRLEQTLLATEDTAATVNSSMLCTIYQETLLLQALVLTTLMLSNATQLHIPSVSRGLESILHVYSSLFARSIVVTNTPKAIFQSITASYIILGVPTEHKIELLPSLFQDGLTFTLGNILAGFSAVINACFLQLKIAKKYNLSSRCSFLLPVCKELRSHLVPSENFDVPGTQFSVQWALNSLVETLSSEGEDQSLSWIEDRLPEIKANEPMYMVDFRPGKNMDPNKARERARVEEKRIKKQKRDEERSARREIRQKAVLRTEQKLKLKTGRERAANRVQHMLEVDQHSYKDLDAARARLLKKRGASGRVGKK